MIRMIPTILLTAVVSAGIIYAIEYFKEPAVSYYGSVPVKDVYVYPELIESVSFTTPHDGKPLDTEFLNILWCHPMNDKIQDYFPYATRRKFYTKFSYFNELKHRATAPARRAITDATLNGIVNNNKAYDGQIEQSDIEPIRDNLDDYTTWFLDDIRPDFGATCYIESESTTFTRWFKIPKRIGYKSISFDYIVE